MVTINVKLNWKTETTAAICNPEEIKITPELVLFYGKNCSCDVRGLIFRSTNDNPLVFKREEIISMVSV